jgi:hypothetical protein
MANTWGGRRTGAGGVKGQRRKKTILESEARDVLIKLILNRFDPIVSSLVKVSEGGYVVKDFDSQGHKLAAPNHQVALELISYIVGKPKQVTDSTVSMPQLEQLQKDISGILAKGKQSVK